MAIGVDFGALLDRKYAIQGQEAAARTTQANAAMENARSQAAATAAAVALDRTRMNLLPAESMAQNALTRAQTRNTSTLTDWIGPRAQSEIALAGAQRRGIDASTEGQRITNVGLGLSALPIFGNAQAVGPVSDAIRGIYQGYRLTQPVTPSRSSSLTDDRDITENGVRVLRGSR